MVYAVIMGGGRGTRFWPESTKKRPKQFLGIGADLTLIQQTVERLNSVVKNDNVFILGNKDYYELTREQLPFLPSENIISEPVGKNTAPCLGLASVIIRQLDPEAVIVALPADHSILDNKRFSQLIMAAAEFASKNERFVTLGIKPTFAHTGYGYIEVNAEYEKCSKESFFPVKRFVEKPDVVTAESFLEKGNFLWNSGMFVFKVNTLLSAIEVHMPDLYEGLLKIEKASKTVDEDRVLFEEFSKLKSVSIDVGIMEKVNNVSLLKCDIGWNDLGSWDALADVNTADINRNVSTKSDLIALDSRGNIVSTSKKLVALIDVDDLVVVESEDVILISKKEKSQRVKEVVQELEKKDLLDFI